VIGRSNPPNSREEKEDYWKTVRNSAEHFSFFLLPFSFFLPDEKKILSRQEGRRKKEEGRSPL
jgi:hypothetical protein